MKNLNAISLSGFAGLLLGLSSSYYFFCNRCCVNNTPPTPITSPISTITDGDARTHYLHYIPVSSPNQIHDTIGFSVPAAVILEAYKMIDQNNNPNPADGVRFYPGLESQGGPKNIVFIGLKNSVSGTTTGEMPGTARKFYNPGSNGKNAGPCPTWCDNSGRRIIRNPAPLPLTEEKGNGTKKDSIL